MDECRNVDMKDRLPELLGEGETGADVATVQAHVASCAACQSELALLRNLRAALPAPRVDAARIAAAIPPYRRVSPWTRVSSSIGIRVAAGLVLAVGLATSIRLLPNGRATADTTVARIEATRVPGELAVGPLGDLTEADLEDLLRDLRDIEAVTPTEEDVVILPALDRSGT